MGTLYFQTTGATTNSGSTDSSTPTISGTGATVSGSVVTLPAGTDLTNVDATAGSATQSTIYLNNANNSNLKTFWITAKAGSGGATPTVTCSSPASPTLSASPSNWAIGGRQSNLQTAIDPLRAGDKLIVNDSTSASGTRISGRRNGSTAEGYIRVVGKSGTRPVITSTDDYTVNLAAEWWWFENLEIATQGASQAAFINIFVRDIIYNCKVSDAGGWGIANNGSNGVAIVGCEVSGTSGGGIQTNAFGKVWGCYVHDLTGDGIRSNAHNTTVEAFNVVDTCTGIGLTSVGTLIAHNTVYNCGSHGIYLQSALGGYEMVIGNICKDNGNVGSEYNYYTDRTDSPDLNSIFHAWNLTDISGARGGGHFSGITQNGHVSGSELSGDPMFNDAANGDFKLDSSSPALASGFPGAISNLSGVNGYLDLGALQAEAVAGGGGGFPSRIAGGLVA